MIEMLAYSRPGVIEVLPALPPSLVKGSINGMLLRTFARLDTTGLGHGCADRGPDGHLGANAGRHVDCPARHRSDLGSAGVLAAKPQPGKAACDLHLPEGSRWRST